MLSTSEIIHSLKQFKKRSAAKYGIRTLGIFGSVARGQQDGDSDLDIFVTLDDADFFILEQIKEELEHLEIMLDKAQSVIERNECIQDVHDFLISPHDYGNFKRLICEANFHWNCTSL